LLLPLHIKLVLKQWTNKVFWVFERNISEI